MSVERGRDWGGTGPLPEGAVIVSTNAELRSVVADARRAGRDPPVVGLRGGDLWRTLGGCEPDHVYVDQVTLATVDIGSALLDGRIHWFVAQLVVRRSWLYGRCWIAANAAHLGAWNLAPRAHPGDGLLDVLDSDLPIGQRIEARRRLRRGDHLPHPAITYRRLAAAQVEFDRPLPVHLDGERVDSVRSLSVRIEPSGLQVAL